MRILPARSFGIASRMVFRVTSGSALATDWKPGLAWLVAVTCRDELRILEQLTAAGIEQLYPLVDDVGLVSIAGLATVVADTQSLKRGDVVALSPQLAQLQVLYRESDLHHTVFLTNRCNSHCLMCSQPPTLRDDSWLVDEARTVAAHICHSPEVIGFTGGEPLLLGMQLRKVLDDFCQYHPDARLEVLTNGRLLHDQVFATELLVGLPPRVWWMVPIYGHADFLHDYVVQCEGAFDETLNGLLTLHAHGQRIQLRIVLIEPTLRILPELCSFIVRNLPYIRQVALMGCEPTGFALANRAVCEVNICDWHDSLTNAVHRLERASMPTVLMNLPLCTLPKSLHRFAHRSISDWKLSYITECHSCQLKAQCCGMFASHKRGWRPAPLRAILEAVNQ